MSNRKNQNSILVLATLGVYLGLVLVGATPQVLAQAAMTRQFNVKDEVEAKDDLDKKPDPTAEDLKRVTDTYFKGLNYFLTEFDTTRSKEHKEPSTLPFESFYLFSALSSPCPADGSSLFIESRSATLLQFEKLLLQTKLRVQRELDFLSDCRPDKNFKGRTHAREFGVVLRYGSKDLTYGVNFDFATSEKTQLALEGLRSAFDAYDPSDTESQASLVLYKNTKLTSVKNQVFIITNLPRAGLDSLLAVSAK